jgi:hypothetical protein
LLIGGASFGTPKTVVLDTDDITAGYVDFTVLAAELGVDGAKSLTAKVTDVAGNVGTASTAVEFTLDTTAPAAPTLVEQGSTDLSANGMNAAEAVTTTFRATLGGTGATAAVAGDTVELLIGGASFGTPKTVTLNSTDITNGYVDFTVVANDLSADGAKSLTAKVTDVAGNAGTSTAVEFTLDTTAPTLPTITGGITGDVSATAENDAVLSENEINDGISLVGTVSESDLAVQICFDNNFSGTVYDATVTVSNWSFLLTNSILSLLSGHNQTVYVKTTDAAGNSSTSSQAFTIGYDIADNQTLSQTSTTSNFIADIYSVGASSSIATTSITTMTNANIKILAGAMDSADSLQINLSNAFSDGGYVGILDADGSISITLDDPVTNLAIFNDASNASTTLDITTDTTGVYNIDNGVRVKGDMMVLLGTNQGYVNILEDFDIALNNNQVLKVTDFSQASLKQASGFNAADDLINIRTIVFSDYDFQTDPVNGGDVVDAGADGLLDALFFNSGTDYTAAATDDFIFYDTDDGKVYYNLNGSYDAGTTVLLLTLVDDIKPTLTASNFQII